MIAISTIGSQIIGGVVSAVLGGTAVGAWATFKKVKPEIGQILVTAAEGVTVMQSRALKDMEERLDGAYTEIAELRSHISEVYELRQKVRALEQENEVLTAERTHLQSDVKHLKRRVAELEAVTNGAG